MFNTKLCALVICSLLVCGIDAFPFGFKKFNGCYEVPSELEEYAKSFSIKGEEIKAYSGINCTGARVPDELVKKVLKAKGYIK